MERLDFEWGSVAPRGAPIDVRLDLRYTCEGSSSQTSDFIRQSWENGGV